MGEFLKQGISYRGIFPKSFVRRVDDAQEDFHDRPVRAHFSSDTINE